ncbi:hypothetical protein TNCV_4048101 [Trichonephila clavipes]|nr:hypothetical protein TNCV_4048101 [Trichonephila clavipes]
MGVSSQQSKASYLSLNSWRNYKTYRESKDVDSQQSTMSQPLAHADTPRDILPRGNITECNCERGSKVIMIMNWRRYRVTDLNRGAIEDSPCTGAIAHLISNS